MSKNRSGNTIAIGEISKVLVEKKVVHIATTLNNPEYLKSMFKIYGIDVNIEETNATIEGKLQFTGFKVTLNG